MKIEVILTNLNLKSFLQILRIESEFEIMDGESDERWKGGKEDGGESIRNKKTRRGKLDDTHCTIS